MPSTISPKPLAVIAAVWVTSPVTSSNKSPAPKSDCLSHLQSGSNGQHHIVTGVVRPTKALIYCSRTNRNRNRYRRTHCQCSGVGVNSCSLVVRCKDRNIVIGIVEYRNAINDQSQAVGAVIDDVWVTSPATSSNKSPAPRVMLSHLQSGSNGQHHIITGGVRPTKAAGSTVVAPTVIGSISTVPLSVRWCRYKRLLLVIRCKDRNVVIALLSIGMHQRSIPKPLAVIDDVWVTSPATSSNKSPAPQSDV